MKLASSALTWTFPRSTASKKLERLSPFFKFCDEAGWTERNPITSVGRPKLTQASDHAVYGRRILPASRRLRSIAETVAAPNQNLVRRGASASVTPIELEMMPRFTRSALARGCGRRRARWAWRCRSARWPTSPRSGAPATSPSALLWRD